MLPELGEKRNGRHTNSKIENRNRRIHLRRIRGGLKMADHLIAVNVLKTITIEIMSNSKLRITIDGFDKHVCEHVSREYMDKTVYICQRYCPEVIVEA